MNDATKTAVTDAKPSERPAPVGLSARAAARVANLIEQQGNPELKLRLSVSGGGCSGFQYGFGFEDAQKPDDIVVTKNGVTMLVDSMSLLYLTGSEVDYVEDLVGASFQVVNPNASSSCGCGSSFAI
ncbi:iron-sulfur cluster insertion protein ErpA [Kordiimonas aquimaris]|uniref:iron-sulfur cluster insertion protein ErpA n=1 Tax=Kordiimonas aquimaris TaxID=707591 RepID=UPI0021D2DFF6|nr:iron-sulfur cluster insertion protein ErpA [Kordiimonas aquimaris]